MNNHGFLKVAAASPKVKVADCTFNTQEITQTMQLAHQKEVAILVFPELCITAYTCADLFLQQTLISNALVALKEVVDASATIDSIAIVGLPLSINNALYNVAAVVNRGHILGFIPKTYLPNSEEFYEKRWFSSGAQLPKDCTVAIAGIAGLIPVNTHILFELPDSFCRFGIEICEDLWTAIPPSSILALSGAELIFNLSASNELIGKHHYRKNLVINQSARTLSGYVYASAGLGESTTDLVFAGDCMVAENGTLLAETNELFSLKNELIVADIDIDRLTQERLKNKSFADNKNILDENVNKVIIVKCPSKSKDIDKDSVINFLLNKKGTASYKLDRWISDTPFLPKDTKDLNAVCSELFTIQTAGLCKRLLHSGISNVVIGVSGGLDSTLALLVLIAVYDKLGFDHKNIHAITMPGFGTSDRTYVNALALMKELGVNSKEIPIAESVLLHFKDIDHNPEVHDVTYENAQARERTQILMDYANKVNALVIGTGDLSELALGWCTYNGDQMSMYGLNAGVPKTLVKATVFWAGEQIFGNTKVQQILHDIVDTPVSPELLPKTERGEMSQVTEDTVGPYVLHDFFIYYVIRYGFTPSKILFLASHAFRGTYDRATILKWMQVFYKRFFTQQFKRSSMPDAPKVGAVGLSPRGDWRMPSDASSALWIAEVENLITEC